MYTLNLNNAVTNKHKQQAEATRVGSSNETYMTHPPSPNQILSFQDNQDTMTTALTYGVVCGWFNIQAATKFQVMDFRTSNLEKMDHPHLMVFQT